MLYDIRSPQLTPQVEQIKKRAGIIRYCIWLSISFCLGVLCATSPWCLVHILFIYLLLCSLSKVFFIERGGEIESREKRRQEKQIEDQEKSRGNYLIHYCSGIAIWVATGMVGWIQHKSNRSHKMERMYFLFPSTVFPLKIVNCIFQSFFPLYICIITKS